MLVIWSEFNEEKNYLNFLVTNKTERPDNFNFAAVRKGSFHTHYRIPPIMPAAWYLIEKNTRVGIQLTSREQSLAALAGLSMPWPKV
ncbi:MAG: hypothetical protein A2W80_09565 [Candidatus Riflebacteria bacterium GWC2_50_8]|nr:MAG: hypothetical protein A2W80_09565 [Candidatus Riflebacteria bacterium GWC2_50_8]